MSMIIEINEMTSEALEGAIDEDNYMLKGVCLFGNRKSQNNRVYSSESIDQLTSMAEGIKSYINHDTPQERKARGGVRSVLDWCGVFSAPRRDGDKVIANMQVRESHFGLFSDICRLQPAGTGFSLNARVKVAQMEDGMESVESIEKIRAFDIVDSAATTSNLWEAHREEIETDVATEFLRKIRGGAQVNEAEVEEFVRAARGQRPLKSKFDQKRLDEWLNEIYTPGVK